LSDDRPVLECQRAFTSRYTFGKVSNCNESSASAGALGVRLEFETLISDTSASLLSAPIDQVHIAVQRALDRVRIFFQADQCHLLSVSADQHAIEIRCAAYADGVRTLPADPNLAALFPWSTHRLLVERRPVVVSALSELPPEAEADRESWTQMFARSALMVPIQTGSEVSHLIMVTTARYECEWPEAFVVRLRVLGEMLVGALERQALFAMVRETEERVNLAAKSGDAGLWTLDSQTGVYWGTERARAIFGFSPDEVVTVESFWQVVHPDDREFVGRMLERARSEAGPLNVEYRVVRAEGDVRWVAALGRTQFTPAGEPERLTGVTIDITERRQAEEALRQSYAEIERLKDKLQAEGEYLKAEIKTAEAHGEVTGQSAAIRTVLHMVEQVAPTDSTVLVRGETGTGKELIAQAIHRLSRRQNHVMVKVNCAALPSGLVESELFGREKGAYTGAMTRQVGRFEIADGSTLFLDEIGELSLDVQAKLLRVLETGEFERLGSPKTVKVNVRLIAATNRDLADFIKQGKFREDLFYRLKVFPVHVPPLRERPEDIPLLVWAFLDEFSSRMGKKITKIPRKAMDTLQRHTWPGNVRELRNVIEHAAIITTGDALRLPVLDEPKSLGSSVQNLADAERDYIVRVLERTRWRIKGPKGAAAELGLNPATLYSRMKKLRIPTRRATSNSAIAGPVGN
jgi:formate hydrogenlyase transcriptional activator